MSDQPEHPNLLIVLCDRLRETGDHFCLLPAFGCEGVNDWTALRP